ncbi:MAG TPA: hypothetical protein PKL31_09715 [Fulvivirga sp.]|nr:hypothetical protein [Fulvivirga sp.]
MKIKLTILSILCLFGAFMLQTSCKKSGNSSPSESEVQLGMLTSTWTLTDVQLDGLPQEGFHNFELTLSGSISATEYNYVTLGRPALSPWPAGGTWSFGSSVNSQIIRDPGTDSELVMTYSINDSALEISYAYSGEGFAGGRTENVSGEWVFTFIKK